MTDTSNTDPSDTGSSEIELDRVEFPAEPSPRAARLLAWTAVVWLLLVAIGLWRWVGVREVQKQRGALRSMREAVERSLAPGEIVVVDDRLLAWALRGRRNGELRQSVWVVSEDAPVDPLLARMEVTKRREILVVATPEDRLIQHLDAAGFGVAQEVGWVPWDVKGNGLALLGRGRMRIYFVVAPKVVAAPMEGTSR